jgi:hypothetical protein
LVQERRAELTEMIRRSVRRGGGIIAEPKLARQRFARFAGSGRVPDRAPAGRRVASHVIAVAGWNAFLNGRAGVGAGL